MVKQSAQLDSTGWKGPETPLQAVFDSSSGLQQDNEVCWGGIF